MTFSWELEGQKPSCLILEDIWESETLHGKQGEWFS